MRKLKEGLSDYTEGEFKALILENRTSPDDEAQAFINWLDDNLQHPESYAIVTHPKEIGIEDTPEAMIAEIKRYYAEQGLPCFKE